jgi:hypothetical protein
MAELTAPTGQPTRSVAAMARRTMRALGTDPAYIRLAYRDALAEATLLRHKLRESELRAEQCRDLLELRGRKIPWPPLTWPARPPTLHEAMRHVLEQRANAWTRLDFVAGEIARQGLYRRRDGLPARSKDVSARTSAYPEWFVRDGYTIRLRDPTARSPRRRNPR